MRYKIQWRSPWGKWEWCNESFIFLRTAAKRVGQRAAKWEYMPVWRVVRVRDGQIMMYAVRPRRYKVIEEKK